MTAAVNLRGSKMLHHALLKYRNKRLAFSGVVLYNDYSVCRTDYGSSHPQRVPDLKQSHPENKDI